jgi:hypothetical protein
MLPGRLKRSIRLIKSACLCFFVCASIAGLAAENLKTLLVRWSFPLGEQIFYEIKQEYRVERKQFDAQSQKWMTTPVHIELVSGHCMLTSLGDGNAHGMVILQVESITDGGVLKELQPLQTLPQLVAQFDMTSAGNFENYQGGSSKETYFILRLVLMTPEMALKESEGKIVPLSVIMKSSADQPALTGSISHELRGFETSQGKDFAKLGFTIDLLESAKEKSKYSSSWKGTGESNFDIGANQLGTASWKIAKKSEIAGHETPSKAALIELFNIDITRDLQKTAKPLFDSMDVVQKKMMTTE